ncbi:pectate lyase [Neiella sp. HB171785]|uniref:Pectate lyase n=1 Tax=Neiella litorisoli TaxID=2771431 RepID=A0A8J6QIZ4_9GAMM|nr:pectate lyase [Neiella litorisoli]MBD1390054.1 pectate lyase [Neiella litorisoli]
MRLQLLLFLTTTICLISTCLATPQQPISLALFEDVIKHWHDQNDDDQSDYFSPGEVVGIADTMLLYQRSNGGWPTNKDPLRKLSRTEREQVLADSANNDASLDNRNTYPQIRYLAAAYGQTGDPRYRHAALAGLEYILTNQYDNGGWAHSPPRTDRYYGHITFADEVMPGVLHLLRDIHQLHPDFDFIPASTRALCSEALAKGDQLILDLQVRQGQQLTVWAGQYDRSTLKPVAGRSYELAGLQSWESVAVVDYLMSIPQPSPQVIRAINSAIAWMDKVKLQRIRIERFDTPPVRFAYHTSTYDLRVIEDPQAAPIWARFYDLQNNQPFFANRDGSRVQSLAEVKRDRRTGYSWYGDWPADLLSKRYPEWQQRLSRHNN